MMIKKVSLEHKLALFDEHWSPKIVGECNHNHIKLVKVQGEFVWHKHELEDELFLVLKGRLDIKLRNQEAIVLDAGEFVIIPKGVEHMPLAREEAHILLVEPKGVINTGDAEPSGRTQKSPQYV